MLQRVGGVLVVVPASWSKPNFCNKRKFLGHFWDTDPRTADPPPRASLERGGGTPCVTFRLGTPSPPPPNTPALTLLGVWAFPYPNTSPHPHLQPPVTAHPPTAFTSPVTALQPLWNCPDRPPSPSSKALPRPLFYHQPRPDARPVRLHRASSRTRPSSASACWRRTTSCCWPSPCGTAAWWSTSPWTRPRG